MNTTTLTIETMVERIVETKQYHAECIGFGDSGTIYWVQSAEDWLLLTQNSKGQRDWNFGSLKDLVDLIEDQDIKSYYDEEIAEYYDESEDEEC